MGEQNDEWNIEWGDNMIKRLYDKKATWWRYKMIKELYDKK